MSIAVTAEQRQLAESVAGFVGRQAPIDRTRAELPGLGAGQPAWYWPALVGQGLHAVHLAESDGGQGGDLTDLAIAVEQAGYGLLPGPFLPTVLASATAQLAAATQPRAAMLADLAGGATAAVMLPGSGITATATSSGWALTGRSQPVLGLLSARVVLAAGRSGCRRCRPAGRRRS
jgi:3-oxochol-4-en-24-oyl-CoA dehydrogenase